MHLKLKVFPSQETTEILLALFERWGVDLTSIENCIQKYDINL